MPIYEYRCKNGHNFEVTQSMADDPVAVCQVCGAPVERVFHPVAVHFKGSGFYTTDYGRKRGGGASSDSDSDTDSGSDSGSKDESKSDSKDSKESKDSTSTKSESSSSTSSSSSSSSSSDD